VARLNAVFALDASYRRFGPVVIGGSPLRLFRLGAGGVRVVEALERGVALPAGHQRLTDRLVDAGAIHPRPRAGPFAVKDVTVVVPAFGASPSVSGYDGVAAVIVVDDGSDPPLGALDGAVTVRRDVNGGPAAARNTGLAAVTTPLVAFVDTDVTADPGWLQTLLAHFADEGGGLVAPRVMSTAGRSVLARYERARSPLDLGGAPARISPGTRVGYVPAAAVVCRRRAIDELGGFDTTLRSGEDVDLVWRLVEHGWRCRYEPAATVEHRPRSDVLAWARQRWTYGCSAGPLEARHRGALAPVRMSGWSAGVWALLAGRRPVVAATLAAGTAAAMARKLGDVPPAESVRLVLRGHLLAGRQLGSAVTRAWLPLALLAVPWRRARLPLAGAALLPLLDWRGDSGLDPLTYAVLRLTDDAAYAAGLWTGVARTRSARALRPSFTPWPGRPG
jgi:mycofactocin system glycosyltransferase